MMPTLPEEALAVVDHAAMARADEAFGRVLRIQRRNATYKDEAETALASARAEVARLIAATVAGSGVDPEAIAHACGAEAAAERDLRFWSAVAAGSDERVHAARERRATEVSEAKRPMVAWAIERRIAMAARLDAARAAHAAREAYMRYNPDPGAKAALGDVEVEARLAVEGIERECAADFQATVDVLCDRRALKAAMPMWPKTSEATERAFWGWPAPEPDPDAA
jgi:hypothetical protein